MPRSAGKWSTPTSHRRASGPLKGPGPADLEYPRWLPLPGCSVLAGVPPHRKPPRIRPSGARLGERRRAFGASSSTREGCRVIDDYRACRARPRTSTGSRRRAAGPSTSLDAESVGRAAVALGAGRGHARRCRRPRGRHHRARAARHERARRRADLPRAPSRRPRPRRGPGAARRGVDIGAALRATALVLDEVRLAGGSDD
jgi:hypothetical protein